MRVHIRGCGSVGRASPCQGEGREFESRHPLHLISLMAVAFLAGTWLLNAEDAFTMPLMAIFFVYIRI